MRKNEYEEDERDPMGGNTVRDGNAVKKIAAEVGVDPSRVKTPS
jgi:hypothetical protein